MSNISSKFKRLLSKRGCLIAFLLIIITPFLPFFLIAGIILLPIIILGGIAQGLIEYIVQQKFDFKR